MEKRGMDRQAILDYFGFEGVYVPPMEEMAKVMTIDHTDAIINYGPNAFSSYDNLKGTYYKESFTLRNFYSKDGFNVDKNLPKKFKYYPEEVDGFLHAYKNQGFYPKNSIGYIGQITTYQLPSIDGPGELYKKAWWHFIYKIPRRW
jgi:hypothetical protein